MRHYPSSVKRVIVNMTRLPGIGEKTAERLVTHMLCMPQKDIEALAESILEMKHSVRLCSLCHSLSDTDLCAICRDPSRDGGVICVVEQPADMAAIEKSGAYTGRYHILQGVLSPICGVGPNDIRIKELLERIGKGGIREVVLATSTGVEGEATASYLAERLRGLPVKTTRIASGVPMGGDLKYVDPVTLKRAMDTRHGV
ncbi:MAG: recombination protein RecR [Deltaproteobacteria bacterium]|nr:recombination protein RecR [Deltaproteobacteria bacterium]PIP35685.1 MAG: recombination protein RecR [Desulfobacterales bacterium CG23_combo_of_CG06-09_8_20_14_all_52_9]PIU50537.1 MAG: recombination protein RecR [Desulfobacterales bacterium CG07_land_8_20_14_0_80_52_14]